MQVAVQRISAHIGLPEAVVFNQSAYDATLNREYTRTIQHSPKTVSTINDHHLDLISKGLLNEAQCRHLYDLYVFGCHRPILLVIRERRLTQIQFQGEVQ